MHEMKTMTETLRKRYMIMTLPRSSFSFSSSLSQLSALSHLLVLQLLASASLMLSPLMQRGRPLHH